MLSLPPTLTRSEAIFGICGPLTFMYSFCYHPKATFKDLSFALLPLLWEGFGSVPWTALCAMAVTLSMAVIMTALSMFLALAIFFRRRLVLWPEDYTQQGRDFIGKPLLFPAKLSHTRMFPEKYNYWYSYFVVGVPVGLHARIGTVLSIDINHPTPYSTLKNVARSRSERIKHCWFTIDPIQYLDRGNDHLGLEGKLHAFLWSQVCAHICKFEKVD